MLFRSVSTDEGKVLMAAINHLSLHVSLCEETVGTPMGESSAVLVAYVRDSTLHGHRDGAGVVGVGARELNIVVFGVFLELPDDGGDLPFLNTTWVIEESLGEEVWWWYANIDRKIMENLTQLVHPFSRGRHHIIVSQHILLIPIHQRHI